MQLKFYTTTLHVLNKLLFIYYILDQVDIYTYSQISVQLVPVYVVTYLKQWENRVFLFYTKCLYKNV